MSVTINIKKEEKPKEKSMHKKMNAILSNYAIMYQNLTGLHWLMKGPHFFGMHAKYEELYDSYDEYIDQVAERILMLDEIPIHTYTAYLKEASIKELEDVSKCSEGVEIVFKDIESLITEAESIVKDAEKAGDIGTADLFIKIVGEQQKVRWMFKAILDGMPDKMK